MLILMVQKKLYNKGFEEAFYYKLEDLFNMEYPMDQNTDNDQYQRQHSAYFVEENLRHLIFIARSHILGDQEKGLERLAKFTFLSMAFPSVYLKNLGLFDPAKALVEEEFDFIHVNSRLDYIFKPMHKVFLKITCSLKCNYFVTSSKSVERLFQRYDSHFYYLWLNEIKVNQMKDLICDNLISMI